MGSSPYNDAFVTYRSQLAAGNMQSAMAREYPAPEKRPQRSVEEQSDDVLPVVVGGVLISSMFDDGGTDGGSSSSD